MKTPAHYLTIHLIALLLAWGGFAMGQSDAGGELEADLQVLTTPLKAYFVRDLPVTQAFEQVWTQSGGKKPEGISFDWRSDSPESKVSLDVKDTPPSEIIDYLTQLAGCRLEIQGRYSIALHFVLHPLTTGDYCAFTVRTVALSHNGARRLGLTETMRSAEILERLAHFGLVFERDRSRELTPFAFYNWKSGHLAAVVPIQEASYVEALARLADRGQLQPSSP